MSKKQIIGFLIFIVLIAGIFIASSFMNKDEDSVRLNNKRDLTTVYVATGGGKEDFIQDEEVVKIIEEEYGLNVVYDSWSNGKLIVKELVREHGKNEYNAMFCSDQRFYDYYKLPADASKGEAERKNVTSGGLILNTPIVIYSWGEIADALMASCPFYTVHTIPAGTYAGQDTDVQTVTVKATLIVSADASEEAVYNLTAAIFDNIEAITAENAKGSELSIENATSGMTVPFHPGAAKYFAEKGVSVN